MRAPTAKQVAAAKAVLKANKKARRDDRLAFGQRAFPARAKPKHGKTVDRGYISWLHGIGCIACRILGQAPAEHAHIEAAHQKAQDADRGWNKKLGVRPDDEKSCPLCAWHHRLGPTRCDPAQAKFWAVLNVDVIAYCNALYAAYQAGADGLAVLADFTRKDAA